MEDQVYRQTIIDKLYEEGNALIDFLANQKELTFFNEAENNFRKNFLLSVASYFEKEITEILVDFATSRSNNDIMVIAFIKKHGISRKYHTMFKWDANNANEFFSNFGNDFKTKAAKYITATKDIESAGRAFLQLGEERNKLVHLNFAEYNLEKTAKELYELYKQAVVFVDFLRKCLLDKEFIEDL